MELQTARVYWVWLIFMLLGHRLQQYAQGQCSTVAWSARQNLLGQCVRIHKQHMPGGAMGD